MKRRWSLGRRGISTIYASLILLILMISFLSVLLSHYFHYNVTLHELTITEQQRLEEEFIISDLMINETAGTITHVVINNTGTIDIRVRAIYVANETLKVLICDPSSYMDTYISPGETLTIPLPSTVTIDLAAELTVTSERGVKSKQYVGVLLYGEPFIPPDYDPGKLYVGPIMLVFLDFHYHRTYSNGTLDPSDYWHPGWNIEKGFGYIAWNITVKNVDDRNITFQLFSSFTLMPNDSPANKLSWYIEPTNQITFSQTLLVNETQTIIFKWTTPTSNQVQKIYSGETTCMGFLTLYGVYHEHDGTTKTYAQTIPFEAVKVNQT